MTQIHQIDGIRSESINNACSVWLALSLLARVKLGSVNHGGIGTDSSMVIGIMLMLDTLMLLLGLLCVDKYPEQPRPDWQ